MSEDDCPHAKPGDHFYAFLRRYGCYECERERYEAWVASVKARMDEALFHLAHGLPTLPLDQLPCAKYPCCDQVLGGGWPALPSGYELVGVSDQLWTADGVNWHVGELPRG